MQYPLSRFNCVHQNHCNFKIKEVEGSENERKEHTNVIYLHHKYIVM